MAISRQIQGNVPPRAETRDPGSLHPFKRALELEAKIARIRDAKVHPDADPKRGEFKTITEQQIALNALEGEYRSRGHGGKHRTKNRSADGRWRQDRSKYDPAEEDLKHAPAASLSPHALALRKALHL